MSVLDANRFSVIPKELSAPFFEKDIMIRYGVPGDGTCFYYSLCAILNIQNFVNQSQQKQIEIGREFRCNITKGLSWEEWQQFVKKEHIDADDAYDNLETLNEKLCSFEEWADEPVIRFVMHKFKINLLFLDEHLNKLYCGVDEPNSTMTGVIYWLNRSHFEPLGRLNGIDVDNDKVAIQFQFSHHQDQDFVRNLMAKYNFQCHL